LANENEIAVRHLEPAAFTALLKGHQSQPSASAYQPF